MRTKAKLEELLKKKMLTSQNEEKTKREAELVVPNNDKKDRADELAIAKADKADREAELVIANEEKKDRADELVIANADKADREAELVIANEEKKDRADELVIANADKADREAELVIANEEKKDRADELVIANADKADREAELIIANEEKRDRTDELVIAKAEKEEREAELVIAKEEKARLAAELIIANEEKAEQSAELVVANAEKAEQSAKLVIANAEKAKNRAVLIISNLEKEKPANELISADKELNYQRREKAKSAAETVIANTEKTKQKAELVIASVGKAKQSLGLILAKKKLLYLQEKEAKQTSEVVIAVAEKAKWAAELTIVNIKKAKRAAELTIANVVKTKLAAELVIANKELVYQNTRKVKRTAELIIADIKKAKLSAELVIANIEKAKRAAEFVIANKQLILAKENKKLVAELIITNRKLTNHISIRKESEEKLKASERRYRRLFESAKDGILILNDLTGEIIDANPFILNMAGLTLDEMVGKELWKIGTFANIIASKEAFRELQLKEYIRFDDMPLVKKDGKIIYVEFISNVYHVENRKVNQCNIRDITERKLIENALRISEERFRMVTESAGEWIWEVDAQGLYTYVSHISESLLGYNSEEIIGKKHFYDFFAPEIKEATKNAVLEGFSKKEDFRKFENPNIHKDGHRVILETRGFPLLDTNGILIGYRGSDTDITERKQIELDLLASKEKAEESDRLKTAFLTNMSHEIRTPMNGILGFSELLKEPNLSSDDQQEYLQIIQISGARMLNTINNIVDISKIESGLVNIEINETNINDKIEFVFNFFKREAETKELQFSFKNGLSSKEAIVKTDTEKVYGILASLVKNAIKFTYDGSIDFGYEKKGEYLEFFVKDTGIGISQKNKKQIFERFRQASESHTRGYEGSGLGLSIAKSYTEMLGGELWMESEEGKGSTFYFTIPYHFVHEEKTLIENSYSDNEFELQDQQHKVLIVEDDEISHLLLTRILQNINCEVLHAITGLEAVEACRTNPGIDLILMDIRMPGMNGHEATHQIRQFNKDVIIVAQTAFAFSGDKEKAIEAGCNSYITKPVNKALLTELVKSYFN